MITILTIILLLIDITSKVLITKYLPLEESIKIIDKFMYFTHVRNTGAAWSMFDDNQLFVVIVSAIIIVGLVGYIRKNKLKDRTEEIAYAFILGGALGNFLNRCSKGYVTDFIDIKIFGYDYPIFNLADLFIVTGVIIFIVYTWRCNNENKGRRK